MRQERGENIAVQIERRLESYFEETKKIEKGQIRKTSMRGTILWLEKEPER